MKQSTLYLTKAAIIAALYVILTYLSALFGLSSGLIQLRLSETLTILPAFTPSAIPGLFVGCILSNTLTGCNLLDIIFGSFATLLGALGSYYIGKRYKLLATLPPIVSNTLIIPFILCYAYGIKPLWIIFISIFAGEFVSVFLLGIPFYLFLKKNINRIGLSDNK